MNTDERRWGKTVPAVLACAVLFGCPDGNGGTPDADDGDTLSVVNVTLSDPTAGTFDTSYAGWWGFTPNADWHGAQ